MNKTIGQHISDLLYYHECVVVPGFGAFLTRYFPAELNTATGMLRPPSKRVAFNSRINENDGLLAKHLSKAGGISYEQAIENLQVTVQTWRRILNSGKKVNLNGIGRLYLDDTRLLQFSPAHDINYNVKSYGLNIFRATAMEREKQIKKSVNRAIENRGQVRKKLTSSSDDDTKEPKKRSWVKWAAIISPVAILIIAGSYLYIQEKDSLKNAAGYVTGVFEKDEKPVNEESEIATDSLNLYEDSETMESSQGISDSEDAISDQTTEEGPAYKPRSEETEEDPYSNPDENYYSSRNESETKETPIEEENTYAGASYSSNSIVQPNYQIIVGSFGSEKNAENYVASLKNKGYDAYLAGKSGTFSRVAIGKYSSQNEALAKLQSIRSNVNYNAWLNDN